MSEVLFKLGIDLDERITQNFIKPLKILNLCANLSSHTSSIQIQVLLNKFLQQITKSPYVFIIPILPKSEEGLIQVIGDKVLDKEIRFPITSDDIINASTKDFQFHISGINRNFRDIIESYVGNKHNTLYFDIRELNKNARSTLPNMEVLAAPSAASSATGLTNCSMMLNDELRTSLTSDDNIQIAYFVVIAGEESCRRYYRYCIYETLRFTIGHLITAIELDEAKRFHRQRKKLFPIMQNLLGKLDGSLMPNREAPGFRKYAIRAGLFKSNYHISNKYVYESDNFNILLNGILKEAREVLDAERCFLFLRDVKTKELVSTLSQNNIEMNIHPSIGVAGHVAETGKIYNMYNTNFYPLYNNIDKQLGFKIRNILYFPIFDNEEVIGVVQVFNKQNAYHFDKCDEESAKAFSVYTSIGIMESIIERQIQSNDARLKLVRELLLYHMKISDHEVKELVLILQNFNDKKIPNLSSFTFRTRDLNVTDTFKASLQMFLDLEFIRKFDISRENELEALSFLISAFCHDMDHRGTSSSYQKLIKSDISLRYKQTGSIMERHHLEETLYTLNDKHSTILDNLTKEQIEKVFAAITNFIISTDTANHFNIKQMEHLNSENCNEYKFLTMTLLMTCCNLSDHVKEWPNPEQVTDLIYQEFFAQGDLERQRGFVPLEIYDRQRAVIPRLQYEFSLDVVLPVYDILKEILPESKELLGIIKDNIDHWESQLVIDFDQ